jgi:hypothetical protein
VLCFGLNGVHFVVFYYFCVVTTILETLVYKVLVLTHVVTPLPKPVNPKHTGTVNADLSCFLYCWFPVVIPVVLTTQTLLTKVQILHRSAMPVGLVAGWCARSASTAPAAGTAGPTGGTSR